MRGGGGKKYVFASEPRKSLKTLREPGNENPAEPENHEIQT
jgi:hypothetical protein